MYSTALSTVGERKLVAAASRGFVSGLTGVDGVGILVGNLNAKLLLNGHDNLDGIERVEAEVVGKVSGGLDLYINSG